MSNDGTALYVGWATARQIEGVTEFDAITGHVLRQNGQVGGGPSNVGPDLTYAGSRLWATFPTGSLGSAVALHTSDLSVTGEVVGGPNSLAIAPDGSAVWVSRGADLDCVDLNDITLASHAVAGGVMRRRRPDARRHLREQRERDRGHTARPRLYHLVRASGRPVVRPRRAPHRRRAVTLGSVGVRGHDGQMSELRDLLVRTASRVADYRDGVADARVFPDVGPADLRAAFGGPLPAGPSSSTEVIDDLVAAATPGLVATTGPRYFGFVIGGALASATAAELLATGWDQPGVQRGLGSGRGGRRRGQRRMVEGTARATGDRFVRLRDRSAGGEHGRSRGGASSRARRGRVRRRARRPGRGATRAGDRERRAPRHDRPVAAAARLRLRTRRGGRGRWQRRDRRRPARRRARDRRAVARRSSSCSRGT